MGNRSEERKAYKRAKIADGTCVACRNAAEPGKTLCEEHLRYQRKYRAARRAHAKAHGLCGVCDIRPREVGTFCRRCRDRLERLWERRSIANSCIKCGLPCGYRAECCTICHRRAEKRFVICGVYVGRTLWCKAMGICVECTTEAARPDRTSCQECADVLVIKGSQYWERKQREKKANAETVRTAA